MKRSGALKITACSMTIVLAAIVPSLADTHYVSPGQSIQAAINDANNGDQIEVAPGTYNEAINFNGKAVTLRSTDPNDPNIVASTVIDGNGYYHVVQCVSGEDANTILEGFTITGGNANGSEPNNRGGGMLNVGSSPTVNDCNFSGNSATSSGGGIYNSSSSPTVTNCIFSGNSAENFGGGMYNNYSSPTVTNCTFSSNSASSNGGGMGSENNSNPIVTNCTFNGNMARYGGGMGNVSSSPMLTNCTFSGNSAYYDGGGIYSSDSNPTVTNCNFSGNVADVNGGGMLNYSSSPNVTDCSFSDNTAYGGGGVGNQNNSNPIVTNCTFSSNTASYGGGGMGSENNSNPIVTNCTFSGNTAQYGGGMGNVSSSPMVTNCTFSGNTADYGGGIYNLESSPIITNCILWGDLPDEIYNFESTTTITYSDIQGGYPDPNNINADPCFIDAAGGDLRLSSDASPCVDAGDNSAANLPTTDLAGNPRVVDGDRDDTAVVDMGAYEFQPWLIHNINKDQWYETIQAAIDDANDGHQIEVGPGTYYEGIDFKGKQVRLYSSGGPEVTVIDANYLHYHVVQCVSVEDAYTILEGFTITGGNANGSGYNECGGGMYNDSSSPTVTNCTFTNNSAKYGGGMYNVVSSPTVTNCTFSGNSASRLGGGMFGTMSSPTVTNCSFTCNSADVNGGGMYNEYGSPTVTNCILWGDTPNEIANFVLGTPIVTYSDIQGGYPDPNNINADPCFIDANSGDLRLRPDSPCIDDGNNMAVPGSILKDLAGKLRFADDPYTIDAGYVGDTGRPVVDMGAYEYQGCGAIPQNLLANPGFETGDATGWMANWGLKADSNQVHDGNYSGLASGRANFWDGAYQSVMGLMDDGKTYRISGWVRLQNADSNYVQLTVKKTDLGGTNFYFIDSATGFDNQWVLLDGTLAIDINGQPTELYVYFEGPVPDVNFYVDDASVTEVTGDLSHNGGVDFFDYSLFAQYYRFNCTTQDCGPANLYDCDNAINEWDLAILVRDWLVGDE